MFWQEVHRTDQLLSLKINSWDSSLTDPIWQFFSNIPVWIPMYVLIVGCLIWRLGWKKGLVFVLAATATFGFCDQFANFIKEKNYVACTIRLIDDFFQPLFELAAVLRACNDSCHIKSDDAL